MTTGEISIAQLIATGPGDVPVPAPARADQPLYTFAPSERAVWLADPKLFALDMFGIETWERQTEILEAVRDHDRVTVRSGHKIGKSLSIALLAYWWFVCVDEARVIMTAPAAHQVRNIIWREIRALWRKAERKPCRLPPKMPHTGIESDDGREIVGLTTDEPENMSGISGANVLFLLDEASGIPQEIFEAIEGNRAGGAKLAMFGNPTKTSGEFYDSHHSKLEFYYPLHISSLESPNVTRGYVMHKGLATYEWVEEKEREWTKESPLYQVRVEGNFPSQSSTAVIGLSLIDDAHARYEDFDHGDAPDGLQLGVDVARFGDDNSDVVCRRGSVAWQGEYEIKGDIRKASVNGFDSLKVAGMVKRVILYTRRHDNEPVKVKVDVIGYGAGTVDELKRANAEGELGEHVSIIAVNVAEVSSMPDDYPNLRTQLWFGIRQWLKEGGTLEPDSRLDGELVSPEYSIDEKGRMVVEKKVKIKSRLGRSPDRAEALMLAIYSPSTEWVGHPTDNAGGSRWESSEGRGFG